MKEINYSLTCKYSGLGFWKTIGSDADATDQMGQDGFDPIHFARVHHLQQLLWMVLETRRNKGFNYAGRS